MSKQINLNDSKSILQSMHVINENLTELIKLVGGINGNQTKIANELQAISHALDRIANKQ